VPTLNEEIEIELSNDALEDANAGKH
jgi:hypothetical protein